jgi:small-conductance mechanosensitive channel
MEGGEWAAHNGRRWPGPAVPRPWRRPVGLAPRDSGAAIVPLALALLLALGPLLPLLPWVGAWAGMPPAAAAVLEPPLAPQAAAPRPQAAEELRDSGSFRRGKVRILGIPVITVASPAVREGGGPTARQRAQVIEGNLELLYRSQEVCTQGEELGEVLLDLFYLRSGQRTCDSNQLGLLGPPASLQLQLEASGNGLPVLQARVPGRDLPLPLLTVTPEDARLHGTTPERLGERWRILLERRLRFARHLLEPGVLGLRFQALAVVELGLVGLLAVGLLLWRHTQHRLRGLVDAAAPSMQPASPWTRWRRRLVFSGLLLLTRIQLGAVLLLLPLIVGVIFLAVPGQIPLAINLLLQPFGVLAKLALGWLLAALLRLLVRALLGQWRGNRSLLPERRARRDQRHHSLLRVFQRLGDLACMALVTAWVVWEIPGVRDLSNNALLASGALLGALALVFQDLLRDFVAGLQVLLEDRYAIGDAITVEHLSGTVLNVGLLATELRCADQSTLIIPNSQCKRVLNGSKLRSGRELRLSVDPQGADPRRALAVIEAELGAFAADPLWSGELLDAPRLLDLRLLGGRQLEVRLVVITRPGSQAPVERELLLRLLAVLRQAAIPLGANEGVLAPREGWAAAKEVAEPESVQPSP